MRIILFYLFYVGFLNAAEVFVEKFDVNEFPIYKNIPHDFRLKIIDNIDKKEYQLLLHSEALKQSRFFSENYLEDKQKDLDENTFHVNSIVYFRNILKFLYGGTINIKGFDDLIRYMMIQLQLDIPNLGEDIISLLNRDETLALTSAAELMQLLKLVHCTTNDIGKCSNIILDYIHKNIGKNKNCSEVELLRAANGNRVLMSKIANVFGVENTPPSQVETFNKYDHELKKLAKKVSRKLAKKDIASVSRSLQATKDVILILKTKYGIDAELQLSLSRYKKYKIKKVR